MSLRSIPSFCLWDFVRRCFLYWKIRCWDDYFLKPYAQKLDDTFETYRTKKKKTANEAGGVSNWQWEVSWSAHSKTTIPFDRSGSLPELTQGLRCIVVRPSSSVTTQGLPKLNCFCFIFDIFLFLVSLFFRAPLFELFLNNAESNLVLLRLYEHHNTTLNYTNQTEKFCWEYIEMNLPKPYLHNVGIEPFCSWG
jgi:hypothetical protein